MAEEIKVKSIYLFLKQGALSKALEHMGVGTASKETLEYLGIGDTEKCVIFSFMTMEKSKIILAELDKHLGKTGIGISCSIPLCSIDSKKSLNFLIGEVSDKNGDGYIVNTENELIVVIANRGYTENVMQVARDAGAPGGTVVHARGTGIESSEKFFGTMIGAEKELIFIVSKATKRNEIMNAIKEKAGINTESGAIAFSLPVNETAGFLVNN